jgi:hypothetical protein
MMPLMTGEELVEAVRKRPELRDLRRPIPVGRGGHFLHVETVFAEAPNVLAHVGAGCDGELRGDGMSVVVGHG